MIWYVIVITVAVCRKGCNSTSEGVISICMIPELRTQNPNFQNSFKLSYSGWHNQEHWGHYKAKEHNSFLKWLENTLSESTDMQIFHANHLLSTIHMVGLCWSKTCVKRDSIGLQVLVRRNISNKGFCMVANLYENS